MSFVRHSEQISSPSIRPKKNFIVPPCSFVDFAMFLILLGLVIVDKICLVRVIAERARIMFVNTFLVTVIMRNCIIISNVKPSSKFDFFLPYGVILLGFRNFHSLAWRECILALSIDEHEMHNVGDMTCGIWPN